MGDENVSGCRSPLIHCPSCMCIPSVSSYSNRTPVLLSKLSSNQYHVHLGKLNECYGTPYTLDDDVTFYTDTTDFKNTSFEIEFFLQDTNSTDLCKQNLFLV